ncbi:MAG TPA: hypothetical protein VHP38_09935 [Ruminiclostridium sp.]|nr:hypothetical protein [Ruminiclostridium sp.]
MKTKLRLISVILVLSLVFPILSGIIQPVFAATQINLSVVPNSYNPSTGALKLTWPSGILNASGNITYHIPGSSGVVQKTVQIDDASKNTVTLSGIKNDIIYDFSIQLTDTDGVNYSGHIYFLPNITVKAEQVDQQYVDNPGGGRESGIFPTIKLTWKMPLIYNGTDMVEARGTALSQIDPTMDKINFAFHLRTKTDLANVLINFDDNAGKYIAKVSGDNTRTSDIKWDATNKQYSLYLAGVKDKDTIAPTMTQVSSGIGISNKIPDTDRPYVLPHQEILPGCIYETTMDTLVSDTNDEYVPSQYLTGSTTSPLSGTVSYTYTPVRFQLSKDAFDTVYVRINSVNLADITMPELHYFVQISDVASTDDSNWKDVQQIVSFDTPYTITSVEGINPKNKVYYRIVVKSDSVDDRIQSLAVPYTMQEDESKTPVPRNVTITNVSLSNIIPNSSERTSDIKIMWDKPSNWDEIKSDSTKEIYYHFLLSVNSKDLDPATKYPLMANGKSYGDYVVKYRLEKYVSSGQISVDSADPTKLTYTLKGNDLFTEVAADGSETPFANPDSYPAYLLPNKAYYLQMYTTLAVNKGTSDSLEMSEKSLTTSFTTLSLTSRDVPTPKNFEWVKTDIVPADATHTVSAAVTLRFQDLKLDWSKYTSNHTSNDKIVYYLYMSSKPDLSTFGAPIGSSDTSNGDVAFTPVVAADGTTWIQETINRFTNTGTFNNLNRFGYSLAPNSTYYFMIKVKLKLPNEDPNEKDSIQTAIVPVTTPRAGATQPDDTAKRPVAPVDFAIALDNNGNPMVSGQSVTFEWTVKENEAAYNLIASSNKIAPDSPETPETDADLLKDTTYTSFIKAFGNKDNNIDDNSKKLTLDPKASPLPPNLVYDSKTKKCRYTINTWLYPNKVYYFTLRAEVTNADSDKPRSSLWVSIPVTTSLIESPTALQVVNDCELSFYWFDNSLQSTPDNYSFRIKAASDKDYTQLTKSQYNIVKGDSAYYGKIFNLKPDTQYTVQVVRLSDNNTISTYSGTTRNDYYQIDVKWQGNAIDEYSGFEIAVKTEDDSDYTVLSDSDLEQYVDISTHTYPYYIEKSFNNLGTNYYTYNARIKYAEVTLPDGTKEDRALKPNTKYYIKVRAYKKDPSNMEAVTRSKYIGPVNTRTEFNQGDYDNNDNDTSVSAKFLDMVNKLEEGLYWDVNKGGSSTTDKIYVKDDKVVNLLEGEGYSTCIIDISQSPAYINSDEVYLAKNILSAMKTYNKSVTIKTKGIEYTIRPDTFDINNMDEFKKAKDATGSKDVYLKLNNYQMSEVQPKAPASTASASKMNVITFQAVASKDTSSNIKDRIKDKLYNDKTGIIQAKLAVIKNPNNLNIKSDNADINKYLNQLLDEVRSELSYYIDDTLNGAGYTAGLFSDKYDIVKYNTPMSVKMVYTGSTIANPYVIYGSVGNWQKLTQNLKYDSGYVTFFVTGPGKYAIFSGKDVTSSISDDSTSKPYIAKLGSKYDLALVFAGADESFNSDLSVTVKEAVLLYELISDSQIDSNTDIKTKARTYGLDKILNTSNINRNINRQETAAIIIKLYCQKTGADYDRYKASYNKVIKDDERIGEKYAIPVYACLNLGVLSLDSGSNFNPTMAISRGEIAVAFQKMLEA